jgi:hypothetical protein
LAARQDAPPSVETSTPPTTPLASPAVPVMVTVLPAVIAAPAAGDVMADWGAAVSVEAVARPRRRAPAGCR